MDKLLRRDPDNVGICDWKNDNCIRNLRKHYNRGPPHGL